MMEKMATQSTPVIPSLYPAGWERKKSLDSGMTILIRPILPADAQLNKKFMQKNTFDDIHHRFFGSMKQLSPDLVDLLTRVDYDGTMAFVAVDKKSIDLLNISRYAKANDSRRAEYTVMTH